MLTRLRSRAALSGVQEVLHAVCRAVAGESPHKLEMLFAVAAVYVYRALFGKQFSLATNLNTVQCAPFNSFELFDALN